MPDTSTPRMHATGQQPLQQAAACGGDEYQQPHPLQYTPIHTQQVSNRYNKPLRVAEMNTISNSGRDGVSNVFAAALWTLDGCFEVRMCVGLYGGGATSSCNRFCGRPLDAGRLL